MKFSILVRSLAWSGIESLCISVLLLFTVFVLANILGPVDFGIASLALGLVFIPQMVVERLFHDAIIQRKELNPPHLDTAFSVSLCVAVVLVLGVCAISPILAKFYNEPRLSTALRLSSLFLLFNGASGILIAYLRRQMLFKVLALRNLTSALFGATVGLAMAINGFGLLSLICQQVVQSFVGMVVIFASVDRLPRLRFSSTYLRDLLGFSTIAVASETIWNSQLRVFIAVLGYQAGPAVVGYFEIASRMVNSLRNIWLNAINPVALSAFSKLQTDTPVLIKNFQYATEINASIAVPVFAGLFVTAPETIHTFLGDAWIASTPIIQLLSLAAIWSSIRQFPPIVFNSLGHPHYNLIGSLIGLIVPTIVLLVMAPTSLIVQGIIWIGRLAITIPMGFWFTYKILSMPPREQVKGVGAPIAASLVMVCLLWVVKTTFLANMMEMIALLFQIILGFLIYCSLLIFFSPQLINRWSRIIKEIRGT